MKEKTFEELIEEKTQRENFFMLTDVGEKFMVQLMYQVREATTEEFCQALLDVPLPAGTVKKIGKIATTTDRITIKE